MENFSLNDDEFSKIKELSNHVDDQILILFWQFTIRTIEELDMVSNQNLSIEMFLMRLIYLNSSKPQKNIKTDYSNKLTEEKNNLSDLKKEAINQIKNVTQEKKIKAEPQTNIKAEGNTLINSFDKLLEACTHNKEIKLKYELEKNVNLVSFEKNRIEISFNDNLDKNFVKDLSLKLFEWTKERWIITFSKMKGEISIKEKLLNDKKDHIKKASNSELYKIVLEKFSDANLLDVKSKKIHKE